MKGQKALAALPWEGKAPELMEKVHYLVEAEPHGATMEVRFYCNRSYGRYHQARADFRVFFSPERGESLVQFRDGIRHWDLARAMRRNGWFAKPDTCYQEISAEDEARLAGALGTGETGNHQLDRLNIWMAEGLVRDRQEQLDASGYIRDEAVELCPEALPSALEGYIRTTILPKDSTLVYKKGNVHGTCYRCGRTVRASGERFRQGNYATCPDCGEQVLAVLDTGSMWAAAFVGNVAFLQKGTDGETVFVRIFHIVRDPEAKFERLTSWLKEVARYAFRGDKAALWVKERQAGIMGGCRTYQLEGWQRSQRINAYAGCDYFMSTGAQEAVVGTRLEYCCLKEYAASGRAANLILYMAHFVRYPVMEFLWKAGYRALVQEKVCGLSQKQTQVIRWKAKTVKAAFRFPMGLLKLKEPGEWMHNDLLRVGAAWNASHDQREVATILDNPQIKMETAAAAMPHTTLARLCRYLQGGERNQSDYLDYIKECQTLGLDLKNRQVLFPTDLQAAHERTAGMVHYEQHKEEAEAFQAQVAALTQLAWSWDGYLIRPAASMEELKQEGAALHHCVAGYAPQMSQGKTAIFLLRRTEEPDRPFYTLELRGKQVVQCRTAHNESMSTCPEVQAFVDEWLWRVVRKKGGKKGKEEQVA